MDTEHTAANCLAQSLARGEMVVYWMCSTNMINTDNSGQIVDNCPTIAVSYVHSELLTVHRECFYDYIEHY